jgi:hypothetical protein
VVAARQVLAQPSDTDVAREQPEAGDHFVEIEQLLALAEGIHHHRDGADFHGVGRKPHEMAVEPLQLGNHHADVRDALGHLEAEQLFRREAERQTVGLRAQVIHPLDQRNHLLPLLLFARLFDAGVEESDRGIGIDDGFAVELQHQPQHAVRTGVLGPHVDGHRLCA